MPEPHLIVAAALLFLGLWGMVVRPRRDSAWTPSQRATARRLSAPTFIVRR
jgi:hypothetical protein